jgi:Family of unknown function (DUF5947)
MTSSPPYTTLRRFLPNKRVERCELCGHDLPATHTHLLEIPTRRLVCACEACGVLFFHRDQSFRRIGRDVRYLADFEMTDAEWDSLRIPIGLAFFVHISAAARVHAFYPGPAGSTESLLPLESWNAIASRNPALENMEPDIEALLVNRIGPARLHFLVPIDRCYELVGLIRIHWRGLSGGDGVWREIDRFFAQLTEAGRA